MGMIIRSWKVIKQSREYRKLSLMNKGYRSLFSAIRYRDIRNQIETISED